MPPLRLEVFEESARAGGNTVVTDLSAMEEARLAAYEQGYTAGWEDATAAQQDEKARLSADLAHNLQALGFTYFEARSHVVRALEPLLTDIVGQLLPMVARHALAPRVLEILLPMADEVANAPIELLFNPTARPAIEPLIEMDSSPPISLVEEPTLGEGQVYLRLGAAEARVDLDDAIAQIDRALSDFFTLSTKDTTHG
ncbi:flagellar biosynthesis protein [Pseudorhodobacter sp.]|uniref:FliH/SctL family protein n=1 Tax=Pseudorhodobacter sp. TaxID=1934400 RepID=UPI0026499B0F|nr:flagellar biosynthesis protein [Pseudorhodobacter sp.]MDN5786670.1 flagellar biosynthesis protein [Pseudorhodobacter sp.]